MKLNTKQREAIEKALSMKDGDILLIDSLAGTGKTTVIEKLVKDIFSNNESVVALTYTKMATNEIKDRVGDVDNVHISTIHKFFLDILKHAYNFYYPPVDNDGVMDKILKEEEEKKAKKVINNHNKKPNYLLYQFKFNKKFVRKAANELLKIKNIGVTPFQSDKEMEYLMSYYGINTNYFTKGGKDTEIDFQLIRDILTESLNQHKRGPQGKKFDPSDIGGYQVAYTDDIFSYNNIYRFYNYIIIDESQDLTASQIHAIMKLYHDKKIILVGDPKQSIYLYNGAVGDFNEYMKKYYPSKTIEEISLTENYRSPQEILDFVNKKFDINMTSSKRNGEAILRDMNLTNYVLNYTQDLSKISILYKKNKDALHLILEFIKNGIAIYFDINKLNLLTGIIADGINILSSDDYRKNKKPNLNISLNEFYERIQLKKRRAYKQDKKDQYQTILNILTTIFSINDIYLYSNKDEKQELRMSDFLMFLKQKIDTKGVKISTIHSMKGLSNKVIILPECSNISKPVRENPSNAEIIQGKNLEYVALTRAKEQIILNQ